MSFSLRKILSILFLVTVFAVVIGLEFHFNFDPGKASAIATGFMFLAMAMQYVFPEQRKKLEKGEFVTDFLYFLGSLGFGAVSSAIVQYGVRWMAPGLLVKSGLIVQGHGLDILPFWAQVIAFLLIVDFGYYWTHRLSHSSSFLFRFHSMHHMPHRVTVLNGSRAHPLDSMWRRALPMFFVLQFGFSKDAAGLGTLLMIIVGFVQHMNVNFEFGFLNRIIGTNEAHRWHHSTVIDEARNYGLLSVWDQIFGTYVMPASRRGPKEMGLEDQGDVPMHRYFYHLILPFLPQKKPASLPIGAQADQA